MSKRLPASMRTRQWLSDVIEGRLSSPAGREELVKLTTRLIIEETLEAEARDAVGRDYYEHGAEPGSGYRNGYRPGRLKTAEGAIDYSAPQVAGKPEPYRSAIREHLKGQTQALAIEVMSYSERSRLACVDRTPVRKPVFPELSPCRPFPSGPKESIRPPRP